MKSDVVSLEDQWFGFCSSFLQYHAVGASVGVGVTEVRNHMMAGRENSWCYCTRLDSSELICSMLTKLLIAHFVLFLLLVVEL